MITGRAQDFIELIEALKNLGNNGHFELLLFTKLNEIDRPFADITIGQLVGAAKTAAAIQTSIDGDKNPTIPQPRPMR
jgi:hypothetical protein